MLTQEIVKEFLDYDPETGKLTWRERDRKWFTSDRTCNSWNVRFPRKEAFTSLNNGGYLEGKILGKYYKAHRVIWLWMTGEWPKEQVDHINHDRTDNRWCNLREASRLENYRNQSQYKNNKSGCTGVCKQGLKWYTQIAVDGKNVYLGRYNSYDDAVAIRKEAEVKYGFHNNHGK